MVIEIPASVTIIDEAIFEGCTELETCLTDRNLLLVTIGVRAFAKCTSLRSFGIPPKVGEIGDGCFNECIHLYRFNFVSSESLKRLVGNRSLDDALEGIGATTSSGLFSIVIKDGGMELKFPGWPYVDDERDSPRCSQNGLDLQWAIILSLHGIYPYPE